MHAVCQDMLYYIPIRMSCHYVFRFLLEMYVAIRVLRGSVHKCRTRTTRGGTPWGSYVEDFSIINSMKNPYDEGGPQHGAKYLYDIYGRFRVKT